MGENQVTRDRYYLKVLDLMALICDIAYTEMHYVCLLGFKIFLENIDILSAFCIGDIFNVFFSHQ